MSLTYGQITAITEKLYIPRMIDNVYDTNALLKRMNRPEYLKLSTGGEKVIAPVISSSTASTAKWYAANDALTTTASDNISAAEFEWKSLFEPIRISRQDLLKNAGDAQKLSLISSKMEIAKSGLQDSLGTGIFSDGSSVPNSIVGLQNLLSTTSTYGGIAVADLASWAASVKSNSAVARSLTLGLMQQADGSATFADDIRPTVLVCNQNILDQVWGLFQAHQRLMSSDMEKLGFENVLTFNGKPVLADSHAIADAICFIDEKHVFLQVMKDENMRVETLEKLESANAMLTKIFWMGALVCNSRRSNCLLSDIAHA
jgi:hypothetical protein